MQETGIRLLFNGAPLSLLFHHRVARKQDVRKAEGTKVGHPHWIENSVQVIAFVLHHASVETIDAPIYRLPMLILPHIAHTGVTRHHAPQPRNTEATLPS